MFFVIWHFEVLPQYVSEFEKHYGTEGSWTQLFRRDPSFRGTRLLRDRSLPLHFLTIDEWDDERSYNNFKSTFAHEYAQLDAQMERFTSQETKIGEFES